MISRFRTAAIAWATVWAAVVIFAGCSSTTKVCKNKSHITDASWAGRKTATPREYLNEVPAGGADGMSSVVVAGHFDDANESIENPGSFGNLGGAVPMLDQASQPLIGGDQLGAPQVTATEHALRLKGENSRMKQAGQKLMTDVRVLRQQAVSKDKLLARVQQAMSVAIEELAAAKAENQELKLKIAAIERQRNEQEMAKRTNSFLDSGRA